PRPLLARMTPTKIRQFAAAAAALETGDLRDVCRPGRRHTLLLCLLATRNKAVERLQDVQAHQRETEERLLGVFWDGPEACR
ncbi:hypothetical protein, partial [Thiorhodococcus minor]|uniref:hypothetical protein n=1 Tax=Thiorhodococcus minor TaxID=57489 RepID=UPI001AD9E3DC